jgi:hypothetical protein
MPALLHLHTLVTPEIPLTGSPEWHRHQIPVRSRTGRILKTAEILAGAFTLALVPSIPLLSPLIIEFPSSCLHCRVDY